MDTENRYQGKVCDNHPEALGWRYLANSTCIECQHARLMAWRAKNPRKVRQNAARYLKKRREKIKAQKVLARKIAAADYKKKFEALPPDTPEGV